MTTLADMTYADLKAIQATRPLTKAEAGKLGGLRTKELYGDTDFFSVIGSMGFAAYCKKYSLTAEQALFRLAKGGCITVDFTSQWKNSPLRKALESNKNTICLCTNHVTAGNDCWTCGGYIL